MFFPFATACIHVACSAKCFLVPLSEPPYRQHEKIKLGSAALNFETKCNISLITCVPRCGCSLQTVARMKGAKGKASQGRLENFFGPVKIVPNEKKAAAELAAKADKRKGKAAGTDRGPAAKKSKGVGGGSKK